MCARLRPQGNIVTCGVLGAYAVVLAVNAYVHTSLSYITLNVLKRLLNDDYSAAFTDVPLQAIGECCPPCSTAVFPVTLALSSVSPPPPLSSRLRHAHGVGGAGRGRRRPAAVP